MSGPAQVPPLVGPADVADLRGAPFLPRELAIASDQVRRACGWHIAPLIETSLERDTDGGTTLLLPTLALREVLAVSDRVRGAELGGWSWSAAGILERPGGWPRGRRAVVVEIRHGLDETPLELVSLVAKLARAERADLTPGVRSEVTTRTVGAVTRTNNRSYGEGDPTSSVLDGFGHVLARYRVDVPA